MATELETEAEKMRRVPGIFFVTDVGRRQPWIRGTGLEVVEIIWVYSGLGWDRERLHEAFGWLSEEQLQAAIDYYAAYPEDVDPLLAEYEAIEAEGLKRQHTRQVTPGPT